MSPLPHHSDVPGRVVDVHAHLLILGIDERAAERDPAGAAAARELEVRRQGLASLDQSRLMIAERFPLLTDTTARLGAMDATGVDVQLVSPSPSHYHPYLKGEAALANAQEASQAIAELVSAAPDRLRGLGLAPLSAPDQMVPALRHASALGLHGVEIGSHGIRTTGSPDATIELSDPALEPFWAEAADRGAIVFLHPFGCTLDARLDRFYLANTVSQPTENAVALSHLIFAGVLDRHPELRIVAAHGGGYLPTTIGRSDRAWHMRPEARTCAEPPSAYLRRLWFDSLTHDPAQLRQLVRVAGADRVLLGSDFPFDMGSDDPVGALRAAGLDPTAQEQILSTNAERLGLLDLP